MQYPFRGKFRDARLIGALSIFCSLASHTLFILYAKWHWEFFRLKYVAGETTWLSWPLIGSLKIASIVAAIFAIGLAFSSLTLGKKGIRQFGTIALIFALWTLWEVATTMM